MTFRFFSSLMAVLVGVLTAHASASETVLFPESLSEYASAFGVGYGYRPQTRDFTFTECVTGRKSEHVVSVPTEAFANPEVIVVPEKSEVKILFKAQTTARRVLSLESKGKIAKYRGAAREAVCGSEYIKELQIGAKIVVARSFVVDGAEDQARLVEILKARVPSLRALWQLDLSNDGLKLRGGGLSLSGNGQTKSLLEKMGKCFWQGSECELFIQQAYADAAQLDEKYPAGRVAQLVLSAREGDAVDFGDALSYTVTPYRK